MDNRMESDLNEMLRLVQKDEMQGDVPLTEEEQQIALNKGELEEQGYKVYPGIPWRRYFARCFDMQLAAAIISLLITLLIMKMSDFFGYGVIYGSDQLFWFIGFLGCVIYLFIEPWIIIMTGTTFGKFTLGIRVLTSRYDRDYTYQRLLKRGFLMLVKGMGFNIPIVNIVTMLVAKSNVEEDDSGQASWDYECGILMGYRNFTLVNYILIVVDLLISIGITINSLM